MSLRSKLISCFLPAVIFSDRTIKEAIATGRVVIDPFDEEMVQPSSVDLRCDYSFRVFENHKYPLIDPKAPQEDLTTLVTATEEEPFILHPGEFVLGATLEIVGLADDIVARLEGKSSLGRLGLLIHSTAGFIDPGFKGQVTLELSNVANLPIAIYPGMKIGQVSFYELTTPAEHPYGSSEAGSKYQGQSGPTASRVHRDFYGRLTQQAGDSPGRYQYADPEQPPGPHRVERPLRPLRCFALPRLIDSEAVAEDHRRPDCEDQLGKQVVQSEDVDDRLAEEGVHPVTLGHHGGGPNSTRSLRGRPLRGRSSRSLCRRRARRTRCGPNTRPSGPNVPRKCGRRSSS